MTVPADTPPPPSPGARPASPPGRRARLRRQPGVAGGVCAGIGAWLGIDPIVLRVVFLVASAAGGIGLLAYVLLWVAVPRSSVARAGARPRSRPGRGRGAAELALGIGLLVLSALLLFRAWGLWVGDQVAWPLVLVSVGAAVLWRQTQTGPQERVDALDRVAGGASGGERAGDAGAPSVAQAPAFRTAAGAGEQRTVADSARLPADAQRRALLGIGLILGGALVFLALTGTLAAARDVIVTVVVVLVAGALILAPWWLRLWRGLSAERSERIRSQERAEVAAHLHDSVLQTLALVQTSADDPRQVALLARRQERDLRAWLNGARPDDAARTLAAALRAAAAEVEDAHGVPVEIVTVGDRPLDPDADALVAATREAMVNAARHAHPPAASPPTASPPAASPPAASPPAASPPAASPPAASPPAAVNVHSVAATDPERTFTPISVYMEVAEGRVEVFVRDRGAGFDPRAIPADRRGVRESIVGRMERHGGRAEIRSAPGAGTEVELVLESRS